MNQVIVTGGTGVTGSALVRFLLDKQIRVIALIRQGSSRRKYLPENPLLTIVESNLEDYESLPSQLEDYEIDAFFHLAWDGSMGKEKVDNRNNMVLQNRNIGHMIAAVNLCKAISCKVFVATGSQAEYGRVDGIIDENTRTNPENGYGSAKLCAGQMSRILCKLYGIRHIWVRLFSIYGPFDGAESLIHTSIKKLRNHENQTYTKGEQMWDYLYSFDAAKALWLLGEKGVDGEIYCLGNGDAKPLAEYIKILHKIVNPELIPELGAIPYGNSQVMRMEVSTKKLRETTGFTPDYTFEEGIAEINKWFEEEENQQRSHIEFAIKEVESYIKDQRVGLPEEVFEFASSITPMTNVDLLIKDSEGRVLLSWRNDKYCGQGWHIPGGIIRFKETMEERIQKVAAKEIGTPVKFKNDIIAVNEIMMPQVVRGHFISFLYQCYLPEGFSIALQDKKPGEEGYLEWHSTCPENLVGGQWKVYNQYFSKLN